VFLQKANAAGGRRPQFLDIHTQPNPQPNGGEVEGAEGEKFAPVAGGGKQIGYRKEGNRRGGAPRRRRGLGVVVRPSQGSVKHPERKNIADNRAIWGAWGCTGPAG